MNVEEGKDSEKSGRHCCTIPFTERQLTDQNVCFSGLVKIDKRLGVNPIKVGTRLQR